MKGISSSGNSPLGVDKNPHDYFEYNQTNENDRIRLQKLQSFAYKDRLYKGMNNISFLEQENYPNITKFEDHSPNIGDFDL